jgi:hypothetical protein
MIEEFGAMQIGSGLQCVAPDCVVENTAMLLRPIDPEADFPQVLELINRFEPEPLSLAAALRWYHRQQPGRIIFVVVAVDAQDRVIG